MSTVKCLALVAFGALCVGGCGNGVDADAGIVDGSAGDSSSRRDGAGTADLSSAQARDMTSSVDAGHVDLEPTPDMSAPKNDLATLPINDLAILPINDLSTLPAHDLALIGVDGSGDLAIAETPDLSVVGNPDMSVAVAPDMSIAVVPDLAVAADLLSPPDLTPAPDLTPPPLPTLAPTGDTAQAGPVDAIFCDTSEMLLFHIHAHLQIYVNGQQELLPAGIGIGTPLQFSGDFVIGGSCFSWLHTHDQSGIIHIESPEQRVYTLGEFFDIWGQPLSSTEVGPAQGVVSAYLNGQPFTGDVTTIPLNNYNLIQLDVGTPAVAAQPYTFPAGY